LKLQCSSLSELRDRYSNLPRPVVTSYTLLYDFIQTQSDLPLASTAPSDALYI
jgi:hypothetical protein